MAEAGAGSLKDTTQDALNGMLRICDQAHLKEAQAQLLIKENPTASKEQVWDFVNGLCAEAKTEATRRGLSVPRR